MTRSTLQQSGAMLVSHTPAWSAEHAWPNHTQHIAHARDFVVEHLEDAGLGSSVMPLRLVTSELVTNAVLHARTPFVVTLSRSGPVLSLVVRDALPQPVDGPAAPPPTQPNGRGLGIVERLSTDWGIRLDDEGKSVWAEFAVAD